MSHARRSLVDACAACLARRRPEVFAGVARVASSTAQVLNSKVVELWFCRLLSFSGPYYWSLEYTIACRIAHPWWSRVYSCGSWVDSTLV